ncbi:TadE/TadG family type IV pilus assembly protein [Humidisolicoccus flavus]|uniref:TadE/TadG family type IV pilus assembly protein n=1 Tax=Humidisolicoccus flavus TaxID=3111414 RepID=UPI00324700A4
MSGNRALIGERGSAIAEFTMVSGLLLAITLAIFQLAFALHVQNTVADAASEGARFAGLIGGDLEAGKARTELLVATAVGPSIIRSSEARFVDDEDLAMVEMTIVATVPQLGLLGFSTFEVSAHAAIESLE